MGGSQHGTAEPEGVAVQGRKIPGASRAVSGWIHRMGAQASSAARNLGKPLVRNDAIKPIIQETLAAKGTCLRTFPRIRLLFRCAGDCQLPPRRRPSTTSTKTSS